MSLPANLVTIHPYFKVHPGKEEQVAAILGKFVAKTRGDSKCLFYEFTSLDDTVFCREGYEPLRDLRPWRLTAPGECPEFAVYRASDRNNMNVELRTVIRTPRLIQVSSSRSPL
jgi:hypothetical protein